jgi:hypothetical protein
MKNMSKIKFKKIQTEANSEDFYLAEITVEEFLKVEPSEYQRTVLGGRLDQRRVLELVPVIGSALEGRGGAPVMLLYINGKVTMVAGHHRQGSASIAVKDGTLSKSYVFAVRVFEDVSKAEAACARYRSNHGSNKKGKNSQIIHEDFPVSQKIFTPIEKAIEACEKHTFLPKGLKDTLVKNLGAFFNNNPKYAQNVIKGEPVSFTGADIYKSKRYPEVGDGVLNAAANVDFRSHVGLLTSIMCPAIDCLASALNNDSWLHAFEGQRSVPAGVVYTTIAAAFDFKVKDTAKERGFITSKRILLCLKNKSNRQKMKTAVKQFPNNAESYSATLHELFSREA